ncbi:hypothetical protein AB1L88_18425 [Tautonia sp. JC769]|uniref:hypothetical protein n=1 Tax=Tautonia sp. JC769 TaxID=3232135 RepID=UPI0034579A9B
MSIVPLLAGIGLLGTPGSQASPAEGEVIQARYEVDLLGRSRVIFALPPGPRTITAFRWVPDPDSPDSWESARLRLVWDGDDPERAGVDVPLGQFARTDDDRPGSFVNDRAMPYRRLGRLVLDAEGPVRGSLRLETVPEATILDDRGYLRATLRAEADEAGREPPLNSENVGENHEREIDPAVRYWYARDPGPVASRR